MILELRLYRPVKGREQALVARFRDSTMRIFDRHGVIIRHFWTAEDSSLIAYVCEWSSADEMRRAWDNFRNDEEWLRTKAASETEGPLVEEIISKVIATPDFFGSPQPGLQAGA